MCWHASAGRTHLWTCLQLLAWPAQEPALACVVELLGMPAGFWQLSGLNADSLHAASSAESAAYTAPTSSAGGAWDAFARPSSGESAWPQCFSFVPITAKGTCNR